MSAELLTATTLLATNLVAWLVFMPRLRRRWVAIGWLEHREQTLAANNRKHPRNRSGQFTTKGTN